MPKEKKEEVKKEETPKEENKEIKEVVQETSEVKGNRDKRWKKFLESYKLQNPVKYEIKKENGELKEIPATFK